MLNPSPPPSTNQFLVEQIVNGVERECVMSSSSGSYRASGVVSDLSLAMRILFYAVSILLPIYIAYFYFHLHINTLILILLAVTSIGSVYSMISWFYIYRDTTLQQYIQSASDEFYTQSEKYGKSKRRSSKSKKKYRDECDAKTMQKRLQERIKRTVKEFEYESRRIDRNIKRYETQSLTSRSKFTTMYPNMQGSTNKKKAAMWRRIIRGRRVYAIQSETSKRTFLAASIAAMFYQIKISQNRKQIMCAFVQTISTLAIYFDIDYDFLIGSFTRIFDLPSFTSMPDFQQQADDSKFDNFVNGLKSLSKTLKYSNTEFCKSMQTYLTIIMSYIICKKIPGTAFSQTVFDALNIRVNKEVSTFDFVQNCVESLTYIVERAQFAYSQSDYMSFFADDGKVLKYEDDCSQVLTEIRFLESGHYDKLSCSEFEFKQKIVDCIETTKKLIQGGTIRDRPYFANRLIRLRDIQSRAVASVNNASMRIAPFSIYFYGGTSVGKTNSSHMCMKYLLAKNGYPSKYRYVSTVNDQDKFNSGYDDAHVGVILDDIANVNPKMADTNPSNIILKMCNNAPMAVLKAEADQKGKIFWNPRIVVGTTNKKDLNASVYSNEPASIVRRFNYVITQTVKDHYKCDNSEMLDTAKAHRANGKNMCDYVVEKAYPIMSEGKEHATIGYQLVKVIRGTINENSDEELLEFLGEQSVIHFKQQTDLIATNNEKYEVDLCEHAMLPHLCSRCFQQQASFRKNYNWFLWISMIAVVTLSAIEEGTIMAHNMLHEVFILTRCPVLLQYMQRAVDILPVIGRVREILYLLAAPTTVPALYVFYICKQCTMWLTNLTFMDLQVARGLGVSGFIKKNHIEIFKCTITGMIIYASLKTIWSFKQVYNLQGSIPMTPEAQPDEKINPWKKCIREFNLPTVPTENTTFDQLRDLVARKIARVTCTSDTGVISCTHIFPLCNTFWMIPNHLLKDGSVFSLDITRSPSHVVGTSFTSHIDEENIYRVPNKDFAIVNLISGGPNLDLTKFIDCDTNLARSNGQVVTKDKLGNSHVIQFTGDSTFEYLEGGYVLPTYRSELSEPTFNGLCMAPYVCDTKKPCIKSFHVAGNGTDALSVRISQDEIQHAIEQLKLQVPTYTISEGNFKPSKYGVDCEPIEDVHKKSPSNFLTEGAIMINYGGHGQRRTFRSNVVGNPISKDVENIMNLPNLFGQPQNMNSYIHWQRHLDNMTHTTNNFNPTILKLAYEDLCETIFDGIPQQRLDRIHPLPNINNLCGADGVYAIEAIDPKTSCGWPLNFPKKNIMDDLLEEVLGVSCPKVIDQKIWDEVSRMEDCLASGQRIYTIFRANLKDEAIKKTKKKVRVFAGTEIAFLLLTRKYLLPLCKLIQENSFLFECAVGINAQGPEWDAFVKHVMQFGIERMINGDFANYDTTLASEITMRGMEILIKIAKKAGFDGRQLAILRGIATEICFPMYEYNGEYILIFGSSPSGHPLTVILNNLANSMYMRYTFYDNYFKQYSVPLKERFNAFVKIMCYGDDNIMSVRQDCDWFDHTKVRDSMKEIGLVYTMADKTAESVPFININEVEFLKRSLVSCDDTGLYKAPLLEASISKSLHCVTKSKVLSSREQSSETIKGALNEFFFHGEEVYQKRAYELSCIASKHDMMMHLSGSFCTYQMRLERHRAKYNISWVMSHKEHVKSMASRSEEY